jgi:hypothetical protein
MKTLLFKTVAVTTLAGLLLAPSAFAKKKPANLSNFAGKYTGTVTFVSPTDTFHGTASVLISVAKNGKSATIKYTAIVLNGSGDSVVLPTEITLAKNKSLSITDLGVGIAGTNNAHRGTGAWSQHRLNLLLSATNGDINFSATGRVKDTHKKRKLSLVLVSADAGGASTFTTTLTSKLPKPKN